MITSVSAPENFRHITFTVSWLKSIASNQERIKIIYKKLTLNKFKINFKKYCKESQTFSYNKVDMNLNRTSA